MSGKSKQNREEQGKRRINRASKKEVADEKEPTPNSVNRDEKEKSANQQPKDRALNTKSKTDHSTSRGMMMMRMMMMRMMMMQMMMISHCNCEEGAERKATNFEKGLKTEL